MEQIDKTWGNWKFKQNLFYVRLKSLQGSKVRKQCLGPKKNVDNTLSTILKLRNLIYIQVCFLKEYWFDPERIQKEHCKEKFVENLLYLWRTNNLMLHSIKINQPYKRLCGLEITLIVCGRKRNNSG